MKNRMRVVIDLQGAQSESRYRGIGRFTMSLTRELLKSNSGHDFFILLNGSLTESIDSIRAELGDLLDESHFKLWYVPCPSARRCAEESCDKDIAVEIREHVLQSLAPDVVLVSSLFEGCDDNAITGIGRPPTLVILYDLIPLVHSEAYLQPSPHYARFYLEKIEELKRATAWLTISRHTALEGTEQLGLDPMRMIPISAACDAVFHKTVIPAEKARACLDKFGIVRPFVLYTGGADKRKNLARLLEAYASLGTSLRTSHQIVLAGKFDRINFELLEAQARSLGLTGDELIFTGYIDDQELCALYNLCKVFVFPSWHEGFGLPALEAMNCGAAVIGANTTSIPEVIGRTDALFNPFDSADIRNKLTHVLNDAKFREELAIHGPGQAAKFSWSHSARMTLQAIETYGARRQHEAPVATENELIDTICQRLAVAGQADKGHLIQLAQALALNQAPTGHRQILVDISELVHRDAKTGIQRVTRSVLLELLKNPPPGYDVRPVYATQDAPGYRYASQFLAKLGNFVITEQSDQVIEANAGDIFIGLDLQHHVVIAQEGYLHFLHRHGIKVYFVVYDLLPILLPQAFSPGKEEAHQRWLSVLINFDGAICISRSVADELKNWAASQHRTQPGPFKIGWFHLGADIKNSSPSLGMPADADEILERLSENPSFLMVGTVEPRKGHALALTAFERLWRDGNNLNLVIVGKAGWMVEALINKLRAHPERGERLFWLEGISDEYLERVYANSTCLIAASEGEGFGLPLIEAAQHKLPIIARDIPVFREVAGHNACFFDGASEENLRLTIQQWLRDHAQGNHPRSEGMSFITWAESAQQLMDNIIPKQDNHRTLQTES